MLKITSRILAFLLISGLFAASSALASHEEHEFTSGLDFGSHIAEHALEGHFAGDTNPGVHHQGFSPWIPGN